MSTKDINIIVAGGRDFYDYPLLYQSLNEIIEKNFKSREITIFSGKARGADKLGEKYANLKGYPIKEFPALWTKHGLAAGHIRNQEMASEADVLVAFWDGSSTGTADMIKRARKNNLDVHVIKYF